MNNNDLDDLNKLMYPDENIENQQNNEEIEKPKEISDISDISDISKNSQIIENVENDENIKNQEDNDEISKQSRFGKINEGINNSINSAIDRSVEFTGNYSSQDEVENLKKASIIDKIAMISQEENLKQYSWLLPNNDVLGFMKKRIKTTCLVAVISTLLSFGILYLNKMFSKMNIPPILFGFIIIALSFFAFKKDYLKLKNVFNKKRNDVYSAFPLWVSTLQILVMSNNITNTFKKSIPTCPACFRNDLEEFVKKIEFDPENKEYYKSFLRRYGIEEIQEIIMDMYAFNKMDKKEIVHQFKNVNKRLNKIQNNIRTRRQEQSLFFISALNSIPILLGSMYVLVISMLLSNF